MDKQIKQLIAFLKGLTPRQQMLLGGAAVAIGVTLWVFVRLFGTPDMQPLYTGLSGSDAQGIAQRLASENVQYTISSDGSTISVPADKIDQMRVEMSQQGPPQSGRLGFELFDKPNWSGSDFSEKVNYQRALEGELERTIQTIDDIQAARVHIVLPHESLFADQDREGKAAVVLKLRGGARIPDTVVAGISRLVSSAVDNLPPENVTVVDADTGAPLQMHSAQSGSSGSSTMETDLSQRLIDTLTPIVGDGGVKASVTVERDPTSGESTQEVYDPNGSVVLTSEESQEQGANAAPAGVPGTASNVPRASGSQAAASAASASTNSAALQNSSKTFAVSKTIRRLVEPAGRVKRMSVALLIDDAVVTTTDKAGKVQETRRKRTPDELKQIQDVAAAAVGLDPSRGDVIAVQNFSFQALPVDQPVRPTVAQRVQTFTEHWSVALRYVGLLLIFALVYFIVLRPIKTQLVASLKATKLDTLAVLKPHVSAEGHVVTSSLPERAVMLEEDVDETSSDVKRVVMLKRDLVDKVKKEPNASSRLVQNWIRQTEAPGPR
ncbi:MAG TPA: flagellar basal-body MS-ring/collar protein FliF [Candidatus Acidoferrales bacterium]|jgi:flagellar M-ring protein FliF|nr:flagellar basal-body MS-ring/collar protein FliF [Candidatus Acidoferrales bacterium]